MLLMVGYRHASAEQIPIAIDVVNAAHGWPVFGLLQARQRERCQLTRVGPVPRVTQQRCSRVRRVAQRVIALSLCGRCDGVETRSETGHGMLDDC